MRRPIPHWICRCALLPLYDSQLMQLFYPQKRNLINGEMSEVGFPLMMEGCSFGRQLLHGSLRAPCVTRGEKYAILGCDSLTYFRSCEAGQGEGRSQSAGLRAAFKSNVTVPSRCFRAWSSCSHRDGWCHLRCSKASEMSTWASGSYRPPCRRHMPFWSSSQSILVYLQWFWVSTWGILRWALTLFLSLDLDRTNSDMGGW